MILGTFIRNASIKRMRKAVGFKEITLDAFEHGLRVPARWPEPARDRILHWAEGWLGPSAPCPAVAGREKMLVEMYIYSSTNKCFIPGNSVISSKRVQTHKVGFHSEGDPVISGSLPSHSGGRHGTETEHIFLIPDHKDRSCGFVGRVPRLTGSSCKNYLKNYLFGSATGPRSGMAARCCFSTKLNKFSQMWNLSRREIDRWLPHLAGRTATNPFTITIFQIFHTISHAFTNHHLFTNC
jgi:hypothetical protein